MISGNNESSNNGTELLVNLCSNKNTHRKEHKILIIGDIHTRGCAWNVETHRSDKFEVSGLMKPGSGKNILVRSTKK